ncbi:MAG: hypothetical protein JWO58_1100 [Chitinophagaceae bacterium]|nr:hypothetical protein [Chitinophagaceae bacterium]
MKKIFLLVSLCGIFSAAAQTSTVSYQESSDAIANPERGFEKYSITDNGYYTTSNYSNIDVAELTGWKNGADKITMIHRNFLLSAYLTAQISDTYLHNIQLDFDRIRAAGFKCLVRFYYSDAYDNTAPQQASKAQILSHIGQLIPVIKQNKDVVYSVQLGLIGTWGESYYTNSSEFGTDGSISSSQWNNRKQVVDSMINGLPGDVFLQVRYPAIKKTMYGSQTLTEATAYGGTASSRIGFFDDAFLNNWGDMGTFSVNSQDQNPVGTSDYTYLANETQFTPMSGESDGLNAPRTNGSNALFELDSCNWTTLNRDYFPDVISNWMSSGDYATIVNKLGYRFVLRTSVMNVSGSLLNIELQLENVGFARALFQREVSLVMVPTGAGTTQQFLLNTDIRRWVKAVSLSQQIDISGLAAGTYDCYLYLPDSNIPDNTAYAIQLANTSLWSDQTGYNALNQQVTVSTVTSVTNNQSTESSVLIHPNPFEEYFFIHSNGLTFDEIMVMNASGQTMLEINPEEIASIIKIPQGLPSGLYFVVLKKDGETVVKKVIKK